MPIFEVTSPDGAKYHIEGPDGATQDDALAQVMAQHQTQPQQTQEQSFAQRVGQAWKNNYAAGAASDAAMQSGQINPLTYAAQRVGEGPVGYMAAPIAEGISNLKNRFEGDISHIYRAMPEGAQTAMSNGIDAVRNSAPGEMVSQGVDAAKAYLAQSPNLSRVLQSAQNVATVAPVMSPSLNALASTMENTSAPIKGPTLAEQAAKDRATANAGYEAQANVPFSDTELQTLKGNLQALTPKSDASRRAWSSAASGHANDLLQSLETEPLTFSGAIDQRNSMNDSWRAATRAGKTNEARQVTAVKDALDKTMINPETGTWQDANRQFGIASTKQDFADFIDVADAKAQPGNSLDTMINKYKNGWQGNALRPNERAILDQITSGSFSKELKRNIAGRLTSAVATGVGAAVGGIPGAVAGDLLGTFASKFARDTIMKDKIAALQEFFDELDKRPMPNVPQASPPSPAPLQLTAPGATMTVDSMGNVSKASNPAHEIVAPEGTNNIGPPSLPVARIVQDPNMTPYEKMQALNEMMKSKKYSK